MADDGSSGTDVDPADNSAAATVTLWDSSTPILDLGDPITGVEGDTVSLEAAFVNVPRSAFVTDDFDAENGGRGAINYYGFANWSVTQGSVDLIGYGSFDLLPGNGLYVDLDGTTLDAGRFATREVFHLGRASTG